MLHILAHLRAMMLKCVMLTLAVSVPAKIFAADEGFLIGSALNKLSIAEYLRAAYLRSECSKLIGAGQLSQLQSKKYQQATAELESRLSHADQNEFRKLAQSSDHRNRLAGYEMTYIINPIATANREGGQLSFTCGASYNQISQIMQNASLAYDAANRR